MKHAAWRTGWVRKRSASRDGRAWLISLMAGVLLAGCASAVPLWPYSSTVPATPTAPAAPMAPGAPTASTAPVAPAAPASPSAAVVEAVPQVTIESSQAGHDAMASTPAATSSSASNTGTPPSASPVSPAAAAPVRIALLLPLRSQALGPAAQAVLSGFQASRARDNAPNVSITVVETDDTPDDILARYNEASRSADIIVGPLTRSGVAAVAQRAQTARPTLALAPPEPVSGAAPTGGNLLRIGLSVEDEARQIAEYLADHQVKGTAFVASTQIAWQQRTAGAFATAWRQRGGEADVIPLALTDGFITPASLVQIRKQIERDRPAIIFVALDAAQARQLREGIGTELPMVGTSQLNPHGSNGWADPDSRLPSMNGVGLLDLPWMVEPDHPAVMVYPRLTVPAGSPPPGADLERLYALGIDAWRVAREIALRHPHMELDGVTGRLDIDFGVGPARFKRTEALAVYRDGMVLPVSPP